MGHDARHIPPNARAPLRRAALPLDVAANEARRLVASLPENGWIAPSHIAALCNVSAWVVCYHCRKFRPLRLWRGSYRFEMCDAQHVALLVELVTRILQVRRVRRGGGVS